MQHTLIKKIHELAIRSGVPTVVNSLDSKLHLANARDNNGNTLVMLATKYGKHDLVEHFLNRGVPVNATNVHGESAKDIAITRNHTHIYEILTRHEYITDRKLSSSYEKNPENSELPYPMPQT